MRARRPVSDFPEARRQQLGACGARRRGQCINHVAEPFLTGCLRRSRDNDYNTPLDGHWGMSAKTTYKAGDVIDVAWCVSADHGGVPQFRLCDDEGLVSAVTTPGYEPTVTDHEALEQCFQRGLLRCDGVESNTCDQVAECYTYARDWEACTDPGKFLHCSGGVPGERGCKNTAETCAHGILARYKLKIPESTKASSHTILSYRWDTYENNEVFVGCADIAITSDGGDAAPVTPRPTPRPTKAADVATPRPTPRPSKAPTKTENWDCSDYSESCHRLDHNNGDAFRAMGPTTSWGSEAVCANKDKQARWSTHWCEKQDLTARRPTRPAPRRQVRQDVDDDALEGGKVSRAGRDDALDDEVVPRRGRGDADRRRAHAELGHLRVPRARRPPRRNRRVVPNRVL